MLNEKQFPGYSAAKAAMYERMSDTHLSAVHSQAQHIMKHGKNESLKPKFEERLKYTTPEMERRKMGTDSMFKSSKPSKKSDVRYGTPSTPGASQSGKPNPNIRYS